MVQEISEQKYIVDFMDGSYGQIGEKGGEKIMQSVWSTDPKAIKPNHYTMKEIKETGFSNLMCIKEVPNA